MKRAVSVGGDLFALEKKTPYPSFASMHKKAGSVGSDLAFMEDPSSLIPSKSEPDLRTASATITKPTKTHSRTNSVDTREAVITFPLFFLIVKAPVHTISPSSGVFRFFQYLDTISYIWISVIISFIIGYLNFSFLWILGNA
jgi:hypothetical protein